MVFSSWLRNLPTAIAYRPSAIGVGSRKPKGLGRKSARFLPRLESLDDRVVPAQVNLTVTSLADSGSGSLRDAIVSADGGSHSDKFTINVAVSGTIDLQSPLPDLNNNIAIQGPGANALKIERAGGASLSSAIVTVDPGQTASLSGVTIANGDHGGIFNNGGTLTVANCAVVNNTIVGTGPFGLVAQGGGIFNFGGSLTVSGSRIAGNTASDAGGISSGGSFVSSASLSISGSILSGNSAVGIDDPVTHNHIVGSGGGMIVLGAFTVTDSTISGNSADGGGGGMQGGGLTAQAATISGCTFSGNSAFWGGGIDQFSFMTISNSAFLGNTSVGGGGGVRIGGPVTVSGCTFSHNSAIGVTLPFGLHISGSGGAIYNNGGSNFNPLSVTVRDSSFDHNSAEFGGAVFNPGALTVSACTFTANSAIEGGGIYNGGTADVRGSAFTGDSASDSGGGLYNLGTASLQQSTLSGNSGTDGGGVFNGTSGTLSLKDSSLTDNFAVLGADLYNAGIVVVNDSIIGVRYDA